jgi:hypothetical protein
MDRRRFFKDVGQYGVGAGVTGSLLNSAALVTGGKRLGNGELSCPVISLDGDWLVVTDPENVGRGQEWFRKPQSGAKPNPVSGVIQQSFPGYWGVAWYWHEITPIPNPYRQGRYLLKFGAVDYLADVWVNGTHVGGHEGGDTPFVIDITNSVRPGAANLIAVRVLVAGNKPIDGILLDETPHRNKRVDYVPGSSYDIGGITEPVELFLTPAVWIDDLYLVPDWKTGNIAVHVGINNPSGKAAAGRVHVDVGIAPSGQTLAAKTLAHQLNSNHSTADTELHVEDHHLWDLAEPFLYRVTARVEVADEDGFHAVSSRCGFRDFRVINGYFRLNGKRLFLRSTHTGNHCPWTQVSPPVARPDLLRMDFYHSKSVGYNCIRAISGLLLPYELDLCDELGLLVYEESYAAWLLHDSPKMKERFEFSVREMILRDRNHPCVGLWGMLNETFDSPTHEVGEGMLKLVRSLDSTRLVLLSSGRWDGHVGTGSVSNPGSSEWECVWAKETPGAANLRVREGKKVNWSHGVGGYVGPDMGDIHFYPEEPESPEVRNLLRTANLDAKPYFVSEAGIGSLYNAIHELRNFEQARIPRDAEDYQFIKSMCDRLNADWGKWGLDAVYPFPEWLLRESQAAMARHRLFVFNNIRANPKVCGYNITGMLDHAYTGEGIWRFWRDYKPGVMDAVQDGWWPVRWCLFAEPTHTYLGRPVKLEAVLANEDVLSPGNYNVRFRVWGPEGIAWDHPATIVIPEVASGEDGPLAVPVLSEDVTLKGPAGSYKIIPYIEEGAAPPESSWEFYLTDPASLPTLNQPIRLWGVPDNVEAWLKSHGATTEAFKGAASVNRELILVGDVSSTGTAEDWKELATRMAKGGSVVFLSPWTFKQGDQSAARLPLAQKGQVRHFHDGIYHKECLAKAHPIFDGLQSRALLNWYYYGPMIPHVLFEGQDTPADGAVAAAFAVGYSMPGGYASGLLTATYKFGNGRFIVNTFPILENLDAHPTADRMLLNLVRYAGDNTGSPLASLPDDFAQQLKAIGYDK